MAKEYDVVVLGAGPGGYVGAIRASQLGLSTAIVEKKYWGGVCLNVGCIPSKALLRNAELAYILNHEARTFGISGDFTLDYGAAFKRSRRVANGLTKGVQFLMRKNKIESFEGWATIEDATSLRVQLNSGEQEELRFKHLIIATGASTKLLPGTALSERVVTYEEQIMEDKLPASVIIAGAGAVGVEFAYIMRNYGVDVTLVEFLDRILPLEDPEISAELAKAFKKLGIQMMTGARVDSIEESGAGVSVVVTPSSGAPETLRAERVLQAIGFQPRVEGYGLENLGLDTQ